MELVRVHLHPGAIWMTMRRWRRGTEVECRLCVDVSPYSLGEKFLFGVAGVVFFGWGWRVCFGLFALVFG